MKRDSDPTRESQFQDLLQAAQPFLKVAIRAVVVDTDLSMEILQRVNLAIWEKRQKFEPGTSFQHWAMAFVRFEILAVRRDFARNREQLFSATAEETAYEASSFFSSIEIDAVERLNAERAALQACLETLGEKEQELLRVRYQDQKSLKDYASETGRSEGGLRVSLHRLRQAIRRCVESRLENSGSTH